MLFYRSGPEQGIKQFEPRIPIKYHTKNKFKRKIIYVTDSPTYAAAFCFEWNDSEGFKLGSDDNRKTWKFHIPKKYIKRLDSPCSMYIFKVPAKRLNTKTPEYFYDIPVKVDKEIKFKTCWDCLNQYKVNIIIKDDKYVTESYINSFLISSTMSDNDK